MTRIKICGITNRQDALVAAEAGADALGFIAVAGSSRYVDAQTYYEITEDLPLFIQCVAVVRHPEEAEEYVPNYVQYYEDTPESLRATGFASSHVRVFRMHGETSLREIADYSNPVGAILLDTYHQDKLGGVGETFDWSLAQKAKMLTSRPVILAGGLTPENVQAALEVVRPDAVDVSSGVELSPGVKDPAKVTAFIRAVRKWDLGQD